MARTGRPQINDDATLAAMADLILADPKMKPTTAFKNVFSAVTTVHSEDSARRRVTLKFNVDRERLLQASVNRRGVRAKPAPSVFQGKHSLGVSDSPFAMALRDVQTQAVGICDSPAFLALREAHQAMAMLSDSPMLERLRDAQQAAAGISGSPAFLALREAHQAMAVLSQNPALEQLREANKVAMALTQNPALEGLREAHQAALGIYDSPEFKAMRVLVGR